MSLVYGFLSVFTGITSILNCSKPERATYLQTIGIITFMSYAIYMVAFLERVGFISALFVSPLLIFHIIGVQKNIAANHP